MLFYSKLEIVTMAGSGQWRGRLCEEIHFTGMDAVKMDRKLINCRARSGQVANIKIKNNLLAITLVLTTLPPSVRVSKVVIEQIGYTIGQYLGSTAERPEVSLSAIIIT